jgi:DNA-binding CsgD family transcriptional regulator
MLIKKPLFMARLGIFVLGFCGLFFIIDVVMDFFSNTESPLNPNTSLIHFLIESLASISIIGVIFLLLDYIKISTQRERQMQESLNQLKQGVSHVVTQHLESLGLSPAELEIGQLLIKGFNLNEISNLRGTSLGTVKAQTHAVYQKAEVSSRADLLSQCLEEVLDYRLLKSAE